MEYENKYVWHLNQYHWISRWCSMGCSKFKILKFKFLMFYNVKVNWGTFKNRIWKEICFTIKSIWMNIQLIICGILEIRKNKIWFFYVWQLNQYNWISSWWSLGPFVWEHNQDNAKASHTFLRLIWQRSTDPKIKTTMK